MFSSKLNTKLSLSVIWISFAVGAKYNGESPNDAGALLQKSQGATVHHISAVGHPLARAFTSPQPKNPEESLQGYSMMKSDKIIRGFKGRSSQNRVIHKVLSSQKAKEVMKKLNSKDCCVSDIFQVEDDKTLVEARKNGVWQFDIALERVFMVLCHFKGKNDDTDNDVLVFTTIPKGSRIKGGPRDEN